MKKSTQTHKRTFKQSLFFLLISFSTLLFLSSGNIQAQTTVNYVMQNAYFPIQFNDGGGLFSNGSTELGMWANTGAKKTVAWRTFKTAGDNTGSNRPLQVGDVFKITVAATRAYGEIGFSLNANGTQGSSYSNNVSGSRIYINTSNFAAWQVNRKEGYSSLSYSPLQSTYKDYIFTVKITSNNTADVFLTVDGTDYRAYNLTMNGSENIDAFSVFGSDMWDGYANHDAYWKQSSTVSNSKSVEFGYFLTSGTYTPGVIADGLDAASISTISVNDVYVGGDSGTSVIFDKANTYSGKTTVNSNATLTVASSGTLGNNSNVFIALNGKLNINTNASASSLREAGFNNGGTAEIASGATLTINGADNGNYFMNSISGAGNLVFAGTGTSVMSLYGTQSYTGTTTVSSGVLELQTSLSSGAITVENGGTLRIQGDNIGIQALTINPGGIVEVNAGKQLTVNGALINNGILTLKSDINGTATIIPLGTVSAGTYKVQQYLNESRNFYISSPVSNGVIPSGPTYYQYAEAENNSNVWTPVTPDGIIKFNEGAGYIVKPSSATTFEFSGTLNNNDLTISGLTSTATTKTGFNLVGNPYPSYVKWNEAIKTELSNTMWYRTKEATGYKFYTYNGTNAGYGGGEVGVPANVTNYIPPMQAFWVRVNPGKTGSLAFTTSLRAHGDIAGNKFKAPAAKKTVNQILRLEVSNGENTDETLIYFNSNASDGFDMYDSPKMMNANGAPEIYTTAGNEQLVINGMNTLPLDNEIPLGMMNARTFSIRANEITNIQHVKVMLKDKLLNTETELNEGAAALNLSSETSTITDRFSIIFRTAGTVTGLDTNNDQQVTAFSNLNNRITVICNGDVNDQSSVSVYNTVGQQMANQKLTKRTTELMNAFTPGVYMVKVFNCGQTITKKVIVK